MRIIIHENLFQEFLLKVRQWPGRPGFNPRSSHAKDSKNVPDTSLLNTQHYNGGIKGKMEQSKERSNYTKGSLRITLN